MYKQIITAMTLLFLILFMAACGKENISRQENTQFGETMEFTVTDQLGRQVKVPIALKRIAALDHFAGNIIFALGAQDTLVQQSLFGKLGAAMAKRDEKFAAKPEVRQGHEKINVEELAGFQPEVIFVNASFDKAELQQLENAGLKVIALRGETIADSFAAVKLAAKVLGCEQQGKEYIADCEKLLKLVEDRVGNIPVEERPKVMFAGPKSIFTAATGEMLQTSILEKAGGRNVAAEISTGRWAAVSPEQVAAWNPDVILLGSSLDMYDENAIYHDVNFKTIKAVQEKQVYAFPSTVGWWDFPAPHCVLGIVWTAQLLYPEKFSDVDMTKIADEFYTKYLGHSFTSLGGRL
ncbi:MAG: ABC transporter substrate-binding protein [Pelosinus sp.]|nr:ABC transporter substrate-binding protein [Pelosinus sp.]